MCGLFGLIGTRWAAGFDAALDTLASRGPDDRGAWHEGDVHLGFRRLAIIDTSTAGHQPMVSADERFVLVFNGEIYNFPELRGELEADGHAFRGGSDSEVLLALLARDGRDALPQLDGMFAFALWDRRERTLLAARDRFGIKPFHYGTADGFAFGSTLAPFLALPGHPRVLDPEALRDYLASQSIPAPRNILRDVRALPPASWLTYDPARGEVKTGRYWSIPPATAAPLPFDDLVEATDAALRASVARQLVADVPLGAFLSGGIDSSLLVSYMAEASGAPVRTFSVGFPGRGRYDESAHARTVAERFGCVHHEFDAEEIDADHLASALGGLDQPFADAAYLPTLALSALTRECVTVALSGDGGDELFGGYPRFLAGESARPPTPWHAAVRGLVRARLLPGNLLGKSLRGRERVLWERVKLGPWPGSRKDLARFLAPDVRPAARVDATMESWREAIGAYGPRADADALMRADLWTYLADDCLCKTDRASMAHSLEVRVPLLGNAVVDLVLPQPAAVKMGGGLKAVLRTLAERRLPRAVWDRPKHGFSVPVRDYFRGAWRERCAAWIDRTEELAPFLDATAVRDQWARTLAGGAERRVTYTLVALLAWLETNPLDA